MMFRSWQEPEEELVPFSSDEGLW